MNHNITAVKKQDMSKVKTIIKKMTPGSAIRSFCVSCCGGASGEVKYCDGDGREPAFDACTFHRYRLGRGRPSVKIIRKLCLQCMGGAPSYVRECETTDCPCYPYRMAKNPARVGKGYFASRERSSHAEIAPVNGVFVFQDQRSVMV